MAASKFTSLVDEEIREFLKTEAQLALPNTYFFKTPFYFENMADYASTIGVANSLNLAVDYLMLSFGVLKNSTKKGCEDDPDVFITYEMQLFRRYYQSIDKTKNSHDILVKNFTILRNKFLNNFDISDGMRHYGIEQSGRMVKFRPSEHVGGINGDWLNLSIQIEVTS